MREPEGNYLAVFSAQSSLTCMCTLVALDSVDCRSKWNLFRWTFLRLRESGAFALNFLLMHYTEHLLGPYCRGNWALLSLDFRPSAVLRISVLLSIRLQK